ncbi:hypothetical protein [Aquimarina rubra]|uniref:ATPase AAA-type core domain-containing protein n=1 Tax=Aquimarina rubra TaxID=1920033 RepID=A0ABW5L8Q6_9FLAO
MSDFKLIAIKTGNKLSKEEFSPVNPINWTPKENHNFLKNLEHNTPFLFFNDYSISDDSNVLTHNVENSIPNLYQLRNNYRTNIEVSSIVGKNGSGKSSLIEILYLAIHNLAIQLEILYDSDKNLVIESQNYLRCELFFLIDEKTSYKLKFQFDDSKRECYLFKSKKEGNVFKYKNEPDNLKKEDLVNLFYTISVNYSIYGLNSQQIGSWITHLFHKNDSYQTPLVINPMRTEGNFDINRENYLFKYRLLSNSVLKYKDQKTDVEIIEDIKLAELIFKLDRSKIKVLESEKKYYDRGKERALKEKTIEELLKESNLGFNIEKLVVLAIKHILGAEYIETNKIVYEKEVQLYIVKKLYRIAFNYNKYWDYLEFGTYSKPIMFETSFNKSKFIDYLKKLSDDHTHITLKLRQALNYILNNPLKTFTPDNSKTRYWFDSNLTGKIYRIPFNQFAEKLLEFSDKIINCLPPSLFKIIINVYKDDREDYFDISTLSSGELQLMQSVQSSIYHLNNLDSYHYSKDIKYKNVLMLFDEIELYFHPEYQRKIVSHLISEIDKLKLKLIKNIHIIYITHSPFVLSDIPHTNQLNLNAGSPFPVTEKTFAANIYELLQSTFYLDSNIGDYSEKVIDIVLNKLNAILDAQESTATKKLINSLKEEFIKQNYLSIIQLIGDRIVRNKLLDMHYKCFPENNSSKKAFLESQIEKFQLELKKLN